MLSIPSVSMSVLQKVLFLKPYDNRSYILVFEILIYKVESGHGSCAVYLDCEYRRPCRIIQKHSRCRVQKNRIIPHSSLNDFPFTPASYAFSCSSTLWYNLFMVTGLSIDESIIPSSIYFRNNKSSSKL